MDTPKKPCTFPVRLTDLCCAGRESACDTDALTLADVADNPGLDDWEAGNKGAYDAPQTALLERYDRALVEAHEQVHMATGRTIIDGCKAILTPCRNVCASGCGSCSACNKRDGLSFGTFGAVFGAGDVVSVVVKRGGHDDEEVALPADSDQNKPWRLELGSRPLLVPQKIDDAIASLPLSDLSLPRGAEGTAWVEVCFGGAPQIYWTAVADLACFKAERCLPQSACTRDVEEIDVGLIDAGYSGIRSVDEVVQLFSSQTAASGGRWYDPDDVTGDFDLVAWAACE